MEQGSGGVKLGSSGEDYNSYHHDNKVGEKKLVS